VFSNSLYNALFLLHFLVMQITKGTGLRALGLLLLSYGLYIVAPWYFFYPPALIQQAESLTWRSVCAELSYNPAHFFFLALVPLVFLASAQIFMKRRGWQTFLVLFVTGVLLAALSVILQNNITVPEQKISSEMIIGFLLNYFFYGIFICAIPFYWLRKPEKIPEQSPQWRWKIFGCHALFVFVLGLLIYLIGQLLSALLYSCFIKSYPFGQILAFFFENIHYLLLAYLTNWPMALFLVYAIVLYRALRWGVPAWMQWIYWGWAVIFLAREVYPNLLTPVEILPLSTIVFTYLAHLALLIFYGVCLRRLLCPKKTTSDFA